MGRQISRTLHATYATAPRTQLRPELGLWVRLDAVWIQGLCKSTDNSVQVINNSTAWYEPTHLIKI